MNSEDLFGLEYELRKRAVAYARAAVNRGDSGDDRNKVDQRMESRREAARELRDAARAYTELADYIDSLPCANSERGLQS